MAYCDNPLCALQEWEWPLALTFQDARIPTAIYPYTRSELWKSSARAMWRKSHGPFRAMADLPVISHETRPFPLGRWLPSWLGWRAGQACAEETTRMAVAESLPVAASPTSSSSCCVLWQPSPGESSVPTRLPILVCPANAVQAWMTLPGYGPSTLVSSSAPM